MCMFHYDNVRFLEMEVQRRLLMLNQRVKNLENENTVLRQRLKDVISGQEDLESYMKRNNITDMLQVNTESSKNNSESESTPSLNGSSNLLNLSSSSSCSSLNNGTAHAAVPVVPPRPTSNSSNGQLTPEQPAVGKRLEGLLMDDLDNDFDPRAYEQSSNNQPKTPSSATSSLTSPSSSSSNSITPPILAPPPKAGRDVARRNYTSTSARAGVEDVFGSTINAATPRPKPQDPFGMGTFSLASNGNSANVSSDFQSAIGILDKKIMEMKDGFSRGLSISTEDFSLESLDPLKN